MPMTIYRSEDHFIVQAHHISKTFPGVKALSDVSFTLREGEIHCIVGENGAGKSTFIKILTGSLRPDSGELVIHGKSYKSLTPYLSQSLGIQVIYQENILVPQMTVAENVFVGRERLNHFGLIDYKETIRLTQTIIDSLKINLDPETPVEKLSPSGQQFVKIVKSLAYEPRILIMDEPTAMFNVKDVEMVLNLVKDISRRGISVIYISHRLEEISEIADRITVFKDGQVVATHENPGKDFDLSVLIREMVGRSVEAFYKKDRNTIGEVVFEVKNLRLHHHSPEINFTLKKGEILGIAGLVGSGRTEMIRALFGMDPKISGEVWYRGKRITIHSPQDSIQAGIGLITEDRHKTGLALNLSVIKNTTIAGLDQYPGPILNLTTEKTDVEQFIQELDIKTPSPYQEVRFLSGGNQQKVVLARWLFKDVDILIFDEPTIGIDVNSKNEIYKLMTELAQKGKSIIMISSELPELIALSDRVIVVKNGRIITELDDDEITEENIISYAFGVTDDGQSEE